MWRWFILIPGVLVWAALLSLFPHSKEVLGLNSSSTQGLSVCVILHPCLCGFSPDTLASTVQRHAVRGGRSIGDFKLPMTGWRLVQGVYSSMLEA